MPLKTDILNVVVDSLYALKQLAAYKKLIDDDIAVYAKQVRASALEQFGKPVLEAETEVFLDLLTRGGKRIRGALVLAGYEMCGGKNQESILPAARAIEMFHAYILMIDDIQDRSALRRGRPSAHKMIEAYHAKHGLRGDAAHTGTSLAINAALAGAHAAQMVLANLDVDSNYRLKALSITNRTMAITAHGQTLDILNELVDMPDEADIERVLEWKTALYSVINPLQVGMVLAGVECPVTTAVTAYGMHAGKAFQVVDDILGIYGDEKELGKTPGDDIREGKGTLLVLYALQHAKPADKKFLRKCLGNPSLTMADFKECQEIIQRSGAVDHANKVAAQHLDQAIESLDQVQGFWTEDGARFLKSLALALKNRTN